MFATRVIKQVTGNYKKSRTDGLGIFRNPPRMNSLRMFLGTTKTSLHNCHLQRKYIEIKID